MTDWLHEIAPDYVYAVLFSTIAVVSFIFGLHTLAVSIVEKRSLLMNFPFWLGLTLLLTMTVIAGTFAFYFFIGAAILTWLGVFIYGPGMIVVIVTFVVWVRGRGGPG